MEKRAWKPRALATLGVVLVCLIPAAIWTLLRSHGISDWAPTFQGACERIKTSGIPPNPGDWWCFTSGWREHANFMWGALSIWIALAFPSTILAATGRRATALIPLIAAPVTLYLLGAHVFYWNGGTGLIGVSVVDILDANLLSSSALLLAIALVGGLAVMGFSGSKLVRRSAAAFICAVTVLFVFAFAFGLSASEITMNLGVNLLLLAAPGAAVVLVVRRREVRLVKAGLDHRVIAAAVCVAASAIVIFFAVQMFEAHGREIGGLDPFGTWPMLAGPSVSIWLFGALLGTNRRYWPWSLAVAALFLSQAPSMLVIYQTYPDAVTNWSMFGAVLPLAIVGLFGSAWQPLTALLARRREPIPAPAVRTSPPRRRFRPVVLPNTAAAVVLIVSFLMYRGDPLPTQISAPLPTLLGLRERANDARTMMNLRDAIATAERYFAKHHTFAGFDAETATALEPSLSWQDGIDSQQPAANPELILPALAMGIVSGSNGRMRIAAWSNSDTSFCVETTANGVTTYGKAPHHGVQAMRAAISACGSTPWTEDAIRPPPELRCTEDSGDYLICRMVQVLVFNTMKNPKPAG